MAERGSGSTVCGLPKFLRIPSNDTGAFMNDLAVCVVNVPFCIFAFLVNLAVLVAVIKTPSLQRPVNILLCGLACTDCLTGLVAQPLFMAWRLMIHHIHKSCDYQTELFQAFWVALSTLTGWSFVNLIVISFDRKFAVSKPLVYRAEKTKIGTLQTVLITGMIWLMGTVFNLSFLPDVVRVRLSAAAGISLVLIPIVNHLRIFIAIRHHNSQIRDSTSHQAVSVIFKREKKAAIDMFIVIAMLILGLAPAVIFGSYDFGGVWHVWSITLTFISSSINPVIYLVRNSDIRSAARSTLIFF